ncbi:MAG: hypothetical protein QF752_17145 [Planctomycetota bacterium]|jgi:hypothetical protein|nr:hypothetical protein [Planctomycetota bacterium]
MNLFLSGEDGQTTRQKFTKNSFLFFSATHGKGHADISSKRENTHLIVASEKDIPIKDIPLDGEKTIFTKREFEITQSPIKERQIDPVIHLTPSAHKV